MSEEKLGVEDIRIVKLVTNETIIGFYTLNTPSLDEHPELDDFIVVLQPHLLSVESQDDDSVAVNLSAWIPYAVDEACLLRKANIIAISQPIPEIIEAYLNIHLYSFNK